MTFTFTEVLLLLITVVVSILAGVFIRVGMRLGSALDSFEETNRRVHDLEPQVRRVLEQLESEMIKVQSVTDKTDQVATDVVTVTNESRRVVLDLIDDLEELRLPARYRAAVAGAKAGFAVLRAARNDD